MYNLLVRSQENKRIFPVRAAAKIITIEPKSDGSYSNENLEFDIDPFFVGRSLVCT